MSRPKHPNKELEAILRSLEGQGWRVTRGGGYYKAYCPPPHARCVKTVKLTPSGPRYALTCEGGVDADVGADLVAGTVDFCVSVQADDAGAALSRALAFVRSALHGAGISTPGPEWVAELVDRGDAVATVRPSELLVNS